MLAIDVFACHHSIGEVTANRIAGPIFLQIRLQCSHIPVPIFYFAITLHQTNIG